MFGGGKYDKECEGLLHQTRADLVLVMIVNGNNGQGFSLSTTRPDIVLKLPEMLHFIASQIETDLQHGKGFSA